MTLAVPARDGNVFVCIDTSGSMQGQPISELNEGLRAFKDEMMAESKGDEEEFTCRVYVLRVLRELHLEKVINCPDVEAVEQEAIDLANGHVCEIDRGRGHLVVASKYSA